MSQLSVIKDREDDHYDHKQQEQKELYLLATSLLLEQSLTAVKLTVLARLVEQVEVCVTMRVGQRLVT